MSEEINKTEGQSIDTNNISTKPDDVSKVKIRTIIAHRFKNHKPTFKKVLPFVLVAIIFFAAGVGADKLFTRNRVNRAFKNRPNIQRRLPNNQNNNQNNNNFRSNKPGA